MGHDNLVFSSPCAARRTNFEEAGLNWFEALGDTVRPVYTNFSIEKNGFTIQKQREKLLVHENCDLEGPEYYSYSSPH